MKFLLNIINEIENYDLMHYHCLNTSDIEIHDSVDDIRKTSSDDIRTWHPPFRHPFPAHITHTSFFNLSSLYYIILIFGLFSISHQQI